MDLVEYTITCIISFKSERVLHTMDQVHAIENEIDVTMAGITGFRRILKKMKHTTVYKSFLIPTLKRRKANLLRVQDLV